MAYECYEEDLDEELEEEEFDGEDYEEDEDEATYCYEGLERRGDTFIVKVSDIDVVAIQLSVEQAFRLVGDLIKNMNKDEIKRLMSILVDAVVK
jgi:hypothetical protein